MVVVKCCSGCGVVKPLGDFHRDRNRPDGRKYRCKECIKEDSRRYREENRAKVLERQRRWREENRGKALEMDRRYYEKNHAKVLERQRRYYDQNRDKVLEKGRRYREENLEYANRRTSRRLNRYQSVTELASTKRGPWSEAEVAILMADDGRTIVAKALELGRTYASCGHKYKRLRRAGVTN